MSERVGKGYVLGRAGMGFGVEGREWGWGEGGVGGW